MNVIYVLYSLVVPFSGVFVSFTGSALNVRCDCFRFIVLERRHVLTLYEGEKESRKMIQSLQIK